MPFGMVPAVLLWVAGISAQAPAFVVVVQLHVGTEDRHLGRQVGHTAEGLPCDSGTVCIGSSPPRRSAVPGARVHVAGSACFPCSFVAAGRSPHRVSSTLF